MARGVCTVYRLGRLDYLAAMEVQGRLAAMRAAGLVGDSLLLLEHPHVYTLGRRGSPADLLAPEGTLGRQGVEVHRADRGGQATYHGPGQLVGYPVVALGPWGGPVAYVRALEAGIVEALAALDVASCAVPGLPGVWVGGGPDGGGGKIAAIGVRISRGVTTHGFALNVNTDLGYFQGIVPCGVPGLRVTSVALELGGAVEMERVEGEVAGAVCRALGLEGRWAEAGDLERLSALEVVAAGGASREARGGEGGATRPG